MKTTITKRLLKESAAGGKGLVNAMFFALQRKVQRKQGIGDPEKAYLKQMIVTDKAEEKDPDPDNPSNAWAYYYMLYFGEERTGVEVDKKKIDLGEPVRTVGETDIIVKLYPEITAKMTLRVTGGEA